MLELNDFEAHAKAVLPRNAWDFYSPGADQSFTTRENNVAFGRSVVRLAMCSHKFVYYKNMVRK